MGFSSGDYFKNTQVRMVWQQEIPKDEIEEVYKIIAENVRNARNERGISQLELTNRVGYKSVSQIAKAETGQEGKHFNIEQLYKIADALGMESMLPFFSGIEKAKERALQRQVEPKPQNDSSYEDDGGKAPWTIQQILNAGKSNKD